MLLFARPVLAQPANQNFDQAAPISGATGSTTGSNVGATTDPRVTIWTTIPGYPNVGGQAVWWVWTAPQSGKFEFDTTGSAFDTMLGVYTGTAQNLTIVSENTGPFVTSPSVLTFQAIAGTVYHIAVDGYQPPVLGGTDEGNIVLNWKPTGGAGDFNFTSSLYLCSANESFAPFNGFMLATPGARLTITRTNGSTGRVLVDYIITNTLYTNYVEVSILGLSYTTNTGTSSSNYVNTNIVYTYKYQTCEYGEFTYLPPLVNYTNIFGTNAGGLLTPPTMTFTNDMSTNPPTFSVPCSGPGATTTTLGMSTLSTFCTNYTLTNIVASAVPFVDYFPFSGTVAFSDYQMSTDLFVTVLPSFTPNQQNNLIVNHAVIGVIPPLAVISDPSGSTPNPFLDPLEDQSIIPPTADTTTIAVLNILDNNAMTYLATVGADPLIGGFWDCNICNYRPVDNPNDPNWWLRGRFGLTNIMNIERCTLECTKNVNGDSVPALAHISVLRYGANASQSVSVSYRIDYLYPYDNFNHFFRDIFGIGDGPDRINPCVGLQAGSDYAVPPSTTFGSGVLGNNVYGSPPDFGVDGNGPVTGTLTFPAFNSRQVIDVQINDLGTVDFNKDLLIEIFVPPATPPQGQIDTTPFIGFVRTCDLTILFNNIDNALGAPVQPAGAADRTHNMDNDPRTDPPYNPRPGANSTVYDVKVQPNQSTVFAGDFTAFDTYPVNRIARMLTTGEPDHSFNPGDGADQFISTIALDPTNNIIIGGAFGSFNRITRNKIARLNSSGALDSGFNPGLGANGTIWKARLQTDGKILIAGEFTVFNTTNRNHIARLNTDGSLDASFDPGLSANGPIYDLAIQSDGRIVIGGQFSSVDNTNRSCIARLNANGSLDPTFNPRSGAGGDSPVIYTVTLQGTQVLVGGNFSAMYGVARNNFARLNSDGSLDFSFNPGDGPDGAVYSIVAQPDGTMVINGQFRNVNQTHRAGIARLYGDGTVDTSFMDTAYNQFAGLPKSYFSATAEPPPVILATDREPGGNIIIGGQFQNVGGGFTRDDIRPRQNIARIVGGSTPGPGNIALMKPTDSADDSGYHFIELIRTNGFDFGTNNLLGPASVSITALQLPAGPGSAVQGIDYVETPGFPGTLGVWNSEPTWATTYPGTWQLKDGTIGPSQGEPSPPAPPGSDGTVWLGHYLGNVSNIVFLTMVQSTNLGDKYLDLQLSAPTDNDGFLLGGEKVPLGVALGNSLSQLEIVDSHRNHGVFNFSSPTYFVTEGSNAVISVIRSGGSAGQVNVTYTVGGPGTTATNGYQFVAVTNTLLFGEGVTNLTFPVITRDNGVAEPEANNYVTLTLTNPTGGAALGLAGISNALLTIVDRDCFKGGGTAQFSTNAGLGLVSASVAGFGVNENAGFALISLERHTCASGVLRVWFSTRDGTARTGFNYLGLTNQLTWNSGDVQPKIIPIPVFDDNIVETSNLTVNLQLSSATLDGVTNAAYLGAVPAGVLYITNTDALGSIAFSAPSYNVNENGGYAIIPVVRTGGAAGTISVQFSAQQGTALPGTDFTPTNGTLTFAPGDLAKLFTVPIIDQSYPQVPRFVALVLSNAVPAFALTNPSVAQLNIVDEHVFNQPPGNLDTTTDPSLGFNGDIFALALQTNAQILVAGDFTQANGVPRNRIARLNPDGSLDASFSSTSASAGANDQVLAIVPQTDQRILIGGRFTVVEGVNRFYLTRLTSSGFIDSTFNPGSGPDNTVLAIAETFVAGNRKVLVGGQFNSIATLSGAYFAQLNDDGSVDTTYAAVVNGAVYAIAVQPDGKVLIGGDFTSVNGSGRNRIARLNADGTLDNSFAPPNGASDSVRAIAIQLDGGILIGGAFTNVNGATFNHIARLNTIGGSDPVFSPGLGANDLVSSISLQGDTRIVLGGQFTFCNGVTRNRITRLNNDGSVDPTINFGLGANEFVAATLVQPADGKIVLAGGFTQYDGQNAFYFARIYGGSFTGSGTFEFDSAQYFVDEVGTNVTINVRRHGGTSGNLGNPNITITFATSDGTAHAGTNYTAVVTNLAFPQGEILRTVTIPVIHDFIITPDLTVNLSLTNPSPVHSPVNLTDPSLGDQPTAVLTIYNDDSGISFSSSAYTVPENTPSGSAVIPIIRTGSSRLAASIDFTTTTNGTAVAGLDYIPVGPLTLGFAAGQGSNYVFVPVLDDTNVFWNNTVTMQVSNAQGALLFAPSMATLTITPANHAPGDIFFVQTNVAVSEGAGSVSLPVVRTNGTSGQVTVAYATVQGTAAPGVNYVATNGFLDFADGQTSANVTVGIIQKTNFQGNTAFSVALSAPTGGATVLNSGSSATVTVVDDHIGLAFSSPIYIATETDGSLIVTVNRSGGTNTTTTVQFSTSDGTAFAGTNYTSTSRLLTFNPGLFAQSVTIPLIYDPQVTGPLYFNLNLTNASGGAQIYANNPATVDELDADAGVAFTNASFSALRSGTNILISVLRSNANTGTVSVNYATTNGTAIAGVDYVSTSGTLTFSNNSILQSFTVPIINNGQFEGDRSFTIGLFNPQPLAHTQLIPPNVASVTITDDTSGLSFSAPAYSASEAGQAVIQVVRSGFTNIPVTVDFATADGSGTNGINYYGTNGTVLFNPGETVHLFTVFSKDDNLVTGDKTVLLSLSSPVNLSTNIGSAVLINPKAAVLTFTEADGSQIVPAGTLLTFESGPVNGEIDPGETVTLQLGLRVASGTNTANLVATLLATNGVASPSGPQTYGALATHGPSVSRPFTFTANGTNGQPIGVTLALQDGAYSTQVVFPFVLGQATARFTNSAIIVINDNASATPYPSTITANGLGGSLIKATATLTNFTHTWPRDVDVLLVSPAGQQTYLMAKTGGSIGVRNVTLTFDDAATNSLSNSNALTSGTFTPTSYALVPPPFPPPAPPAPYYTNLSLFNGSNPNGTWSLFVLDDTALHVGAISNGWLLSLTTASLVPANADVALTISASAPSVVLLSNLTYTITVTNFGPATASGVVVTDTLPAAVTYASSGASTGSVSTNGAGLVTWSVRTLAVNAGATLTLIVQANTTGTITNTAFVVTSSADLNPDDATASVATTITSQTADLSLAALVSSPGNPAWAGSPLTYYITVSNAGPATAAAATVSDTLPGSFVFDSASAPYTINGNVVTITLGDIGAGSQVLSSVVATPTLGGTFTNTASCTSLTLDPFKFNNSASVKTIIQALQVSLARGANRSLVFTWPTNPPGSALQYATSLRPPIVWTPITSPPATLSGSQWTLTLGATNGPRYFRVQAPSPP